MKEFKVIVSDLLQGERLTSAKELHERLGVKTDFSTWFKRRVEDSLLEEGVDYVQVDGKDEFSPNLGKTSEKDLGGRPTIDYALTDDTVKHICMLEKTKAGKDIRQYFIARDKQLAKIESTNIPSYLIDDELQRAKAWVAEKEKRLVLEYKNTILEDKLTTKESILSFTQSAKEINPELTVNTLKCYLIDVIGWMTESDNVTSSAEIGCLEKKNGFINDNGQQFNGNLGMTAKGRAVIKERFQRELNDNPGLLQRLKNIYKAKRSRRTA